MTFSGILILIGILVIVQALFKSKRAIAEHNEKEFWKSLGVKGVSRCDVCSKLYPKKFMKLSYGAAICGGCDRDGIDGAPGSVRRLRRQ